jgi:hypothetical protein
LHRGCRPCQGPRLHHAKGAVRQRDNEDGAML